MAFCSNCGKQLPEGALFCGYCGNKQPVLPAAPAYNPPVQPAAPVYAQPVQPETPVYNQPEAPVYTPPVQPTAPAESPMPESEVPVYFAPEAPAYAQPAEPVAPVYNPPAFEPPYGSVPQEEAPRKRSLWKILLPILGGVLLLALVVVLVLVFSKTHVEFIEVEENTITLWAEDTYRVEYEAYPQDHDDEITWHSSDESVATVENGKILGVGDGVCTITVRAENGVEAEIDVEVKTKICVEAFEVDTTEVRVQVGETCSVGWYVYPENYNEPVSWVSSDPSVATVSDSGEICGVNEGTCTVTLSAESGAIKKIMVEVSNLGEPELLAIGDWTSYGAYVDGEYVYYGDVYLWIYEDGTGVMTLDGDSLYFTWECYDSDYECYYYDIYIDDGTNCFMVVYYDGEYEGDLDFYLTDDFGIFFE